MKKRVRNNAIVPLVHCKQCTLQPPRVLTGVVSAMTAGPPTIAHHAYTLSLPLGRRCIYRCRTAGPLANRSRTDSGPRPSGYHPIPKPG